MKEFESSTYTPIFPIHQFEFVDGSVFLPEEFCILAFDGKIHPISHNECIALCCLLEYPNTFVMRKTLIEEIWGKRGLLVDENSLNQCISRLRKQINHANLKNILHIHTQPKIGYKISVTNSVNYKENRKFTYEKIKIPIILSIFSMLFFLIYIYSEKNKDSLNFSKVMFQSFTNENKYIKKTLDVNGKKMTTYCIKNIRLDEKLKSNHNMICIFKDKIPNVNYGTKK